MNHTIICFVLWIFPLNTDSLKDIPVIFNNYKFDLKRCIINAMGNSQGKSGTYNIY